MKKLIYIFRKSIEKLVYIWDPDYTKVTPRERKMLKQAEKNLEQHRTVSHEDIDWD